MKVFAAISIYFATRPQSSTVWPLCVSPFSCFALFKLPFVVASVCDFSWIKLERSTGGVKGNLSLHSYMLESLNQFFAVNCKKPTLFVHLSFLQICAINICKDMAQWVGKMVSIKCTDDVGTYQGEISEATSSKITLQKAFCDGFPCAHGPVQIRYGSTKCFPQKHLDNCTVTSTERAI